MNAAHVHLVLNHERHEDIAKVAIRATGALAAVAFFALGVVGYAANLGGQIRHTEITAHR